MDKLTGMNVHAFQFPISKCEGKIWAFTFIGAFPCIESTLNHPLKTAAFYTAIIFLK